jgi:dienelactone hydrolase
MAIKTQDIDYAFGNTQMRGFLAFDDAKPGERPGVLVCHEWWGLNDYIRGRSKQIASLGYAAMALDLYGNGKTASNPDEAGKLMNALFSNADAKGRVQAAFDAFAAQPMVDGNKLAAIGYCMGGALALNMARGGMALKGVVSLHGTLTTQQPARPGSMNARVLICTGADDPMIPLDQVRAFADEMKQCGADYEINIYGGAKHAFTNPNADKAGLAALQYNPSADRRSWGAMEMFLRDVLG